MEQYPLSPHPLRLMHCVHSEPVHPSWQLHSPGLLHEPWVQPVLQIGVGQPDASVPVHPEQQYSLVHFSWQPGKKPPSAQENTWCLSLYPSPHDWSQFAGQMEQEVVLVSVHTRPLTSSSGAKTTAAVIVSSAGVPMA